MTGRSWQQVARGVGPGPGDHAERYAARFDALAAAGQDVHGEATFVDALLRPGSRVLDGGCGTGRVGQRLHALGHRVVGVDADEAMVAVARRRAPEVDWRCGDLADLAALALPAPCDGIVLAGNVVPFLSPGTLPAVAAGLAGLLAPGGVLVCGFGMSRSSLPAGVAVVPLVEWERAADAAGLTLQERYGGWGREAFSGGYVVTVHRAGAVDRDPPTPDAGIAPAVP